MRNCLKAINYLVMVAALLFTVSPVRAFADASAPNPACILADDFGDLAKGRFNVKASGEGEVDGKGVFKPKDPFGWLDTGIDVMAEAELQISSKGDIELCSNNPAAYETAFISDPKVEEWQNTGIRLNSADKYKIRVNGSWNKGNGSFVSGNRMYVYVGSSAPDPVANASEIISIYDSRNKELTATNSGNIYVWYQDGAGEYGNNSASSDHAVIVTTFRSCPGAFGEYMYAYIGNDQPPADIIPGASGSNLINLSLYAHEDNTVEPPRPTGVFKDTVRGDGRLWFKIIDKKGYGGDSDYTPVQYSSYSDSSSEEVVGVNGSNEGAYIVDVVTKKPVSDGFSNILDEIISPVRTFIMGDSNAVPPTDGLTRRMYKGITENVDFVAGVRAAMALSIVFFAFNYMVGLSRITQKEFIHFAIKMSFMITLIGPTSWEFFYQYLFTLFLEGTDNLLQIMTSQFQHIAASPIAAAPYNITQADINNGVPNPGLIPGLSTDGGYDIVRSNFAFLNETMARFFTTETNMKILALMMSFPIGFILGIMIYIAIAFFIFTVMKVLFVYLTSIIMISLLLFIAPIVIPFKMFKVTNSIFDKWLGQLISFSLQPVLLFTVLSIFNVFVFSTFYQLLSFDVCWSCVLSVDLPISEIIDNAFGNFDKFCVFSSYTPWGLHNGLDAASKIAKTPVGIFVVFIFFILTDIMLKLTDWITNIAGTMGAGAQSISAGDNSFADNAKAGISSGVGMATGAAKWTANRADQATGRRVSDKMKTTARAALPRFATSGGSDGMGGNTHYSDRFMTSREKRALKRERHEFAKLDKKQQAGYKKMKQDERKYLGKEDPQKWKDANWTEKKKLRKEAKEALRQREKDEAKLTGKKSSIFSTTEDKNKRAAEYNKARMNRQELLKYNDSTSASERTKLRADRADRLRDEHGLDKAGRVARREQIRKENLERRSADNYRVTKDDKGKYKAEFTNKDERDNNLFEDLYRSVSDRNNDDEDNS